MMQVDLYNRSYLVVQDLVFVVIDILIVGLYRKTLI